MKIRITLLAAACGVALGACGGDTPAPAEPVEPEFVPEARERRGAEPTAESVFGKKD